MENSQTIKTNEFKVIKKLSIFPIIIVGDDFIFTKKWFKFIKIKVQKIKTRYLEFDDGLNYKFYWSKWHYSWKFIKII